MIVFLSAGTTGCERRPRSLEGTIGPLSYRSVGNAIEITDCDRTKTGTVTIPSSIVGLPVTIIGPKAFRSNRLKKVVIPNGVKEIRSEAFFFCGMESVELPNSLVHIGERAFYGCRNLSEVSLPDNIRTMEKDVFKTCRRLTKIDLPANLNTIHEGAFRKCGITSLVIPGKVSRIDREAFGSCRQLKHVHLPKNIPEIADDAFGFIRPKALDKVTIEASPITYPPEILNNRLRTRIESQLSIKRRIEQRRSREEKALSMP